jgi:hypothetical protein
MTTTKENFKRSQKKEFRRRFSPIPNFTLGYEWEMEVIGDGTWGGIDISPFQRKHRICKEKEALGQDGSLDDNNFEYASCIHNTREFLGNGSDKERKRWALFKRHFDMRPRNSAGLHIHIGLKDFTLNQLAKIDYFLNANPVFFMGLAGGGNDAYASFSSLGKAAKGQSIHRTAYRLNRATHQSLTPIRSAAIFWTKIQKHMRFDCDGYKYRAMNIHPDYATSEFRFPRTTDKHNVFLRRIQMIIALCAFVKMESPSWRIKKEQWLQDFITFVNKNRRYFPYLYEAINKNLKKEVEKKERFAE